jgi:predicted membrane protein
MNKKFFIAWIVLFIAWFIGSFVVHGVLLRPDYMQLTGLFRAEGDQQKFFPLMLVAHVLLSGAFVWIYARGVEPKPWLAQGVRFGIAVALLTIVPTYLIYYVVQPMPGEVVIKQIVFDGMLIVVLGAMVAWLYRGAPART